MKIYHSTCAGNRNFGDILGPYIINKLTKHDVEYADVEQADGVIIGSIMEHLPEHYEGIVAGVVVTQQIPNLLTRVQFLSPVLNSLTVLV